MAGLGTRFAIERVKVGNYLPKVVRACALLDPKIFIGWARMRSAYFKTTYCQLGPTISLTSK